MRGQFINAQFGRNLRPHPVAAAVATLLLGASVPAAAQVLPSGASVVSGAAAIATNAGRMTVTNTPNAIINWNAFSIGAQNAVRFDQQSAASQVLNRVTGNDPSAILGSLSSNGRVWLLNPNGVLFGQGARVDVGGLVASTLGIRDADFLAGRYSFQSGSAGGVQSQVVNQGTIETPLGGRVWLIGDSVRNEGLINTPEGSIVLAAGKTIELVDSATPNVSVRISAPENQAVNLGSLVSSAGSIDVQAGIVNQQGIVRADGIGSDPAGRIVIRASGGVTLSDASITSASSATAGNGGSVSVSADSGTTRISGQVTATSASALGGHVRLLGQKVALTGAAAVDASGATGGGDVLVGGDYQGKNPDVQNASVTYLGPDTSIRSNATDRGDGGRVILWGDTMTRVYGTVEAKGGPNAGNGGFVETSGASLDARPKSIDVSATTGAPGTWLLDPNNILIDAQGNTDTYSTTYTYGPASDLPDAVNITSTTDSSVVGADVLARNLNLGTNVVVSTGTGAPNTQVGDIEVRANITATASTPGSLTLQAHNDIKIDPSVAITSSGGPMNVNLLADSDKNGLGGVFINPNATISTNGGSISVIGTALSAATIGTANASRAGTGVLISAATLDAGAGNITINGTGRDSGFGVWITTPTNDLTSRSILSGSNVDIRGLASVDLLATSIEAAGAVTISGERGPTGSTAIEVTKGTSIFGQSVAFTSLGGFIDIRAASATSSGAPSSVEGAQVTMQAPGLNVSEGSSISAGTFGYTGGNLTLNNAVIGAGQGLTVKASSVDMSASSLAAGQQSTKAALISPAPPGGITVSADSISLDQSSITATGPVSIASSSLDMTGNSSISGSAIDMLTDSLSMTGGSLNSTGDLSVSGLSMDFSGSQLSAGGHLSISADDVSLTNSQLTANASSNALTISTGYLSSSGSTLSAPNDRWLVYLGAGQAPTVVSDLSSLNYTFAQFNAPSGSTPALSGVGQNGLLIADPLNVSLRVNASRPYDGTTLATFNSLVSSNVPQGMTVNTLDSTTVSGSFADKNVGIDKPIAYSGQKFSLSTSDKRPIYGSSFTYTSDITPRLISESGLSAADKVYDGTRDATVSGTLAGVLPGDSVSLSGAVGLFDTKNVGTGKTVTISGGSLAGTDAANYQLSGSATTTASITPKSLTGNVSAANKVYDGTRDATVTFGSLSGVVAGDQVGLAGTGTFDTKNVGTNKPVTVQGATLTGADASNYTLTGTLSTAADITALPIQVSQYGLTAADKVYDGTRNAVLSGTLAGVLPGDNVVLSAAAGLFDTKNVGTGKTVTFSGGSLAGADAPNYQLVVGSAFTTASITPKALSGSVTAANKVYDGTRDATVTFGALSGVVSGDQVGVSGAGAFDTKDVGTHKPVTIQGATLTGADAPNYTLSGALVTAADITARPVQVDLIGEVKKTYDATTLASIGANQYALRGAIATDTVSVSGPSAGNFDNPNVGTGKMVTATGGFQLSGADAHNYVLASTSASDPIGIVTPATLTYTAAPSVGIIGLPFSPLTGTVTGFMGADTLGSQTTGVLTWTTPAGSNSGPGLYAILGGGLTSQNYAFVQAATNANALLITANTDPAADQFRAQSASVNSIDSSTASTLASLQVPGTGAVFDLSWLSGAGLFAPVSVSDSSQDELLRLLEERRRFKRKLFADAIYKLELDPTLADVPVCASAADGASGNCRYTPEQLEQLRAGAAPDSSTPRAPSTTAAALPQIHRKVAVLFGEGHYADAKIPTLENSIPDVEAVSKLFADKLGYETRVLKNPTKAEIVAAMNRLAAELGPQDSLLVYYAGHGYTFERNGVGYWLPSDVPVDDPRRWISNNDVSKMLANVRAKQVAVVTDSCYSGAFAREGEAEIGREVKPDEVLNKRSVVVLSSGGDEPVADVGKEGHSIFAWNLMNTLKSVDNWTPGDTIFVDVQKGVRKEFPQTPHYGAVTAAGHQPGGDYLFERR